jgi:iron complex outermembrane recepter protein
MKQYLLMIIACAIIVFSNAQITDSTHNVDSADILQQVVVHAYENNRRLVEVPAAVSVIGRTDLSRFNNISILPALNSKPGIRMEERSPASYRLNIRGSSLRSPFGVRNVKVYYNNIPYTDPGGNTYLNQLGFYNIQSIEVIKGPGSSIYGAGTGGVVLLQSEAESWRPGASIDYQLGSFNMQNLHANLQFGSENFRQTISYQQVKSDGYRDQTAMDRKVFTWDADARVSEKGKLQTHFLYGDLMYQTPGALTAVEFQQNPRAARPGAQASKAAFYSTMFLAGVNYSYAFNDHWKSNTSLYGAFTRIKNPTTRNYEYRMEPHTGGRTTIEYDQTAGTTQMKFIAGAELQQGYSTIRVSGNKGGVPDTLQTDDQVNNLQYFIFAQAAIEFQHGWSVTAGASINRLSVDFTRVSVVPPFKENRKYNNEIAPRVALLKKLGSDLTVYGSVAKGFSPPTTAELLPSTGVISTNLEPEQGINYEIGSRGSFINDRLFIDVNAFWFRLSNTIVTRRDTLGADYFVNAGSTKQYGIETFVSYRITGSNNRIFPLTRIWFSHTWHNFHYDEYTKVAADTADFSGNQLPSVAPHVFTAGLDINTKPGIYSNITWFYSDPIALNDANTVFAAAFQTLGARLGFRKSWTNKFSTDLFGSVDNIFNVQYSLGNDINAPGGRYFNAAPGINYSAGVSLKYSFK